MSLKTAIFTVTVAAATALVVAFRRHPTSCYLRSDTRPQFHFRSVLADNSNSKFETLQGKSSQENHPYEKEIKILLENPVLEFGFPSDVIPELAESYVWVGTETLLNQLAEKLGKQIFFAVDTEQHMLRSFRGFTALIQISTLQEDFLVDTIALHDVMSILRPVFSDPDICKVFHGAENDIIWLQREFHIYVVNMFDTAKACLALSKPKNSLAYLLEHVCGVSTNKMLRCEDWRQRPLSDQMVRYARIDSHYLLHIANRLTEELKQDNFLPLACKESNKICLKLYAKEKYQDFPGSAAASSLVSKHTISLDAKELVRGLCAWRDLMARIHDESTGYVLSDRAILALVSKKQTTIREVCDTITGAEVSVKLPLSEVVISHLADVYQIIKGVNLDEFLLMILVRSLGTEGGTCPISVFNCLLLENFKKQIISRSAPKKNEDKQLTPKATRKKVSCKTKSVCVGCGEENQNQRFRIVPSCYRDNFPENLKGNCPQDSLLLCVRCHRLAHVAAEKYKTYIAVEFQILLCIAIRSRADDDLVRRAATALLRHADLLPPLRAKELSEAYYGGRDVSEEDLEKASCIVSSDDSDKGHRLHGKQTVDHLLQISGEEEIQKLCQIWRKVFVNAVHPKNLSDG